jgi:hypothetical protein
MPQKLRISASGAIVSLDGVKRLLALDQVVISNE